MPTEVPVRPVVKGHVQAVLPGGGEVFCFSRQATWVWNSPSVARVISLLDGTRTLAEVIAALDGQVFAPEVVYIVRQLTSLGIVADDDLDPALDREDRPARSRWSWFELGIGSASGVAALGQARLAVQSLGEGSAVQALAGALEATGMRIDEGPDPDLLVVLTDHYFRPELKDINRSTLRRGTPWMLCNLVGEQLWVGPLLVPGRTACLECLTARMTLNRQIEDFAVRTTGDRSLYATASGTNRLTVALGAQWAAKEIARWIGGDQSVAGSILCVDTREGRVALSTHPVVRRPQCPACGTPSAWPATPEGTPVRAPAESLRAEPIEETERRLAIQVSPLTGIVTAVHPVDSVGALHDVVHNYVATHHFRLGPPTPSWLAQSLRMAARGKGVSPSQARTAAICEAIERYCAVYRPDRPTVRATAAELGAAAIHPDAVLLFSEEQFSTREERNRSIHGTGLDVVPHRLPPDVPVRWAAGRSLVSGAELLLPASVAFFGHVDSDGPFFGTGEASGTATGGSVVEATVHALLELIERDSVGIWWYSQLSRPLLDVAEVSHSFVSRVAARLGGAGRSFWLLDVTADLGVPVVVAVSRCTDGPTEDLIFGFGAGLTLRSAAVRATAELAQFLPAVGERAADGRTRYRWPNDVGPRFWRNETLATQPQLAPHPTLRSPVQEPGPAEVDLHDVRDRLVADLAGHGLDPIVMDLTEPDVGLSAVRVTVPGLRHIWRRLGPGRLYDVPVQLGWLTTPRRERDLNPTDIFF